MCMKLLFFFGNLSHNGAFWYRPLGTEFTSEASHCQNQPHTESLVMQFSMFDKWIILYYSCYDTTNPSGEFQQSSQSTDIMQLTANAYRISTLLRQTFKHLIDDSLKRGGMDGCAYLPIFYLLQPCGSTASASRCHQVAAAGRRRECHESLWVTSRLTGFLGAVERYPEPALQTFFFKTGQAEQVVGGGSLHLKIEKLRLAKI